MLRCGQADDRGGCRRGRRRRRRLRDGPLRLRADPAGRAGGVRGVRDGPGPDRERHLRRLPRRTGLRAAALGTTGAASPHDGGWRVRGPGRCGRRARPLALDPRRGGSAERQCRRMGVGSLLGHRDRGGAAPSPADPAGGDHDREQRGVGRTRGAGSVRDVGSLAAHVGGHRRGRGRSRTGEPARGAPGGPA